MKVAIVYIPRSKSTMTHEILAKKFNLESLKEVLTFSRRLKQSYEEYPALINMINVTNNICVKICINDFIDTKNCKINNAYKNIDWASFDHIIFIKRQDVMGTVASFGHHHLFDPAKWHRKKGQDFEGRTYEIDINRVAYILRAYRMFDEIKHVVQHSAPDTKIYDYDFETVEQSLIQDFDVVRQDFDIEIEPCGLDYSKLATNYHHIKNILPKMYESIMNIDVSKLDDSDSEFWHHNVSFI